MDEESKKRVVVWIIQVLIGFRRVTLPNDSSDSDNESEQNLYQADTGRKSYKVLR